MHSHSLQDWRHEHVFLGDRHDEHERRTWIVVALTTTMMVVEIVAGTVFGSMALVADGWHMSTHAAALAIAALAYRFARRHAYDPRFSLGTGKLGELAGFASAVILAVVALIIAVEAGLRLVAPVPIAFDQALVVAVIGLAVNLASAWLLSGGAGHHDHEHAHPHDHGRAQDHDHDHNLRAAYFHVLADALTSVLAIAGLLAGRFFGLAWMDALVALVGAAVIARWSFGLVRSSGAVLLDMNDQGLARRIGERLEIEGDRLSDLHVWRIGPGHNAVVAAIVSDRPQDPSAYKRRLEGLHGLSHVSIEVNACPDHRTARAEVS